MISPMDEVGGPEVPDLPDSFMAFLFILRDKKPVQAKSLREFAHWMSDYKRRVVAQFEDGNARVSTVFLAISAQIYPTKRFFFETVVFGGPLDGRSWRYETWEEAEAGHTAAVAEVKAAVEAAN